MIDASESNRKWIFEKCPECGTVGRIDEEQEQGKVSIICTCGNHYYRSG